jgi:hypothetical protein
MGKGQSCLLKKFGCMQPLPIKVSSLAAPQKAPMQWSSMIPTVMEKVPAAYAPAHPVNFEHVSGGRRSPLLQRIV